MNWCCAMRVNGAAGCFRRRLSEANTFCSTLVDRIVTGYPRDEAEQIETQLGYKDAFLDTAEHFYLFVIQGPKSLAAELRLDKLPLNVLIVDDIKPYKERKVAILNGAHTALVPVAGRPVWTPSVKR